MTLREDAKAGDKHAGRDRTGKCKGTEGGKEADDKCEGDETPSPFDSTVANSNQEYIGHQTDQPNMMQCRRPTGWQRE